MSQIDEVIGAAAATVREAERRARGESPDRRFDIPITILRDLAENLVDEIGVERGPKGPFVPPEGATWCVAHQTYDLCETVALWS